MRRKEGERERHLLKQIIAIFLEEPIYQQIPTGWFKVASAFAFLP